MSVSTKDLEKFVLDNQSHLEEIKHSLSEFNIFNVLGIQHREIRHSNFIGWLFDPNESHQLGDILLKDLFKLLRKKNLISSEKMVSLLLENLDTTEVYRESENIDILIINKELDILICIENKVHHDFSKHQLNDYYEYVEGTYSEITNRLYVALTPKVTDVYKLLPSGNKYTNITYKDIITILSENLSLINKTLPTVKESINQYIRMVKKDIMHNSKEVKLAREIYGKYRNEINFIVDNSLDLIKHKNTIERLFKNEELGGYLLSHPEREENHIIRVLPNDFDFLTLFNYPPFECWNGDYIFAIEVFFEKTKVYLKLCFGRIRAEDNQVREGAQNIKTELLKKMKRFSSIQNSNIKTYNSRATSDYPVICTYNLLRDEEVLNSEKLFETLFSENFKKAEEEFIKPFIEECILNLKVENSNE